MQKKGGMVVCSRDTLSRCIICRKPSIALCDATRKDGTPCDAPMCEKHRNRVGVDTDVCKFHNSPKYINIALENRKRMEGAKKYFIEKYQRSPVRVTPGHWPEFRSKEQVDEWFKMHEIIEKSFDDLFAKEGGLK